MSDNNNQETRSRRNKQRRNQNQTLKLAIGLVAVVLAVFLLEFFIGFGNDGSEEGQAFNQSSQSESSMIIRSSESEASSASEASSSSIAQEESSSASEESESEESKQNEDVQEVASNDPNVIRAYEGSWQPIGTSQSEPHVTNYNDGSADRIEIKRAVSRATGVPENDMIENWVGNNGDQKVTATVTQPSTGRVYKVYLSWIAQQGWQVTRVEELRGA